MDQPPNGRRASLIPRLSRLPVPSSRTNRAAGELPRPAPPGTGGLTVAKRRTTGNQAPVSSSSGQNIDQALTAQPRATAQDEEDNAVELEENDSSAGGDAITSTQSTLVAEEDHAGGMNLDEVGPPVDQTGSRIRKPRPSLLERTVQTIAQIPPTPSPSRRKSSFYQSQSPMQGPSVPGEHASAVLDPEIKMVLTTAQAETGSPGPRMAPRGPPPAGLRGPSSSSGQRAPAFALPRSVSNPHRTGALQRTMSSGSTGPRNEASGKTAGGTMTRAQGKLAAGRLQNKPGASVTRPGAQKPRKGPQSVSSISVGAETDDDRDQRSDITQTSTAKAPSSNSGRTHQSSTISSSLKKRSDDPNSSPASAGKATKSSAALRESIAKAKAAQKKALQKPPVKLESGSAMSIDLPEAIFDPVLNLDAPTLELITSGQPSLRQRVEAARMSGRLNISAMGLRAIPDEVMNMYHPEQLDSSKGAWYESVDLVKLSAADNELETIDERVFPDVDPDMELDGTDEREYIFGGVEVLDLHRNRLQTLPAGLRFLRRLTSLHLSHNKLTNSCMDVLVQCETIKDLDLSDNQLSGTLDPRIDRLQHLVALNLAGNTVSELPESLGGLHALRTLNLSNNSFTSLPFNVLAHMSLTELRASNNRIAGTLVSTESTTMETLQYLDLTHNELASLVDSQELHLPSIREFYVSNNRLTSLPAVTGWEELLTLDASHNRLTDFPTGLADLQKIKQIALKGNNIREVDPRISTIVSLEKIDLSGNPLRRKKYLTMGTEALKEDLRSQLEPEVEATEGEAAHNAAGDLGPTQRLAESDAREGWPLKPGGVLDRSSTQMEDLDAVTLQATAAENNIRSLLLHHNLLSLIPPTLDVVASTLTTLDLSHNKLNAQDYLTTSLDLPHLSTLNLSCNTISTLEPLQEHLSAPRLTTLDISANRIVALPSLGASFPALTKLIANDNAISDITVDSLRGLKIIDLRNNDIGHVPPHLGLLTEIDRLDLGGNRFRVPSWNVLAKGTKETLSWLRDKIPLDERDVVPVEELD